MFTPYANKLLIMVKHRRVANLFGFWNGFDGNTGDCVIVDFESEAKDMTGKPEWILKRIHDRLTADGWDII